MSLQSLLSSNNYALFVRTNQQSYAVDNNVVAVTSGTQSTSYLVQRDYTNVTTAEPGAGLRLPIGALGDTYIISNQSLNYIKIFPGNNQQINGFALNTPVNVLATAVASFTYTNGWTMICENSVDATKFPGATADIQINAAVASLPSTGGTINCKAYGASTQIVAATVYLGSGDSQVTVEFDPATVFVPQFANAHMFWLRNCCICTGLSCDVSSVVFTGKVLKLVDDRYSNQPGVNPSARGQTALNQFTIFGGTNTTGEGIYCESKNASQFVQFVNFTNIAITGLAVAISVVVQTDGWFEGNNFYGVLCDTNVCALKFDSTTSTIANPIPGNQFFGFNYEYDTMLPNVGEKIIWFTGPNIVYNSFYGIRLWDIPVGAPQYNLYIDDSTSINNTFMGQVNTAGVFDASNTSIIQDLNGGVYWGNINNTNTNNSIKYSDIRLLNPTSGYRFNNQPVLWANGADTKIGPTTPATGNVVLSTNNDTTTAFLSSAGDFTSNHFNVPSASQTTAYKINGTSVVWGSSTTDTNITPVDVASGKVVLNTGSYTKQCTFGPAGNLTCPAVNSTNGYSTNSVAGVTAGPFTTISSITVTGGIITAITGS